MLGLSIPGVAYRNTSSLAARVNALFRAGEQGVWYDPSDISTLYQDAAGTTPVTAMEQPVGLILDKSKWLVLGPELVTNGDFSNGTTGWSVSAGCAVSSGNVTFTTVGVGAGISQYAATQFIAGRHYQVEFDLLAYTSGSGPRVRIGGSGNFYSSTTSIGRKKLIIPAGATSTFLQILETDGNGSYTIDNISVRELPGNHAYQSTSASRPVLSARVNMMTYTEQFDNAAWTKTGTTITPNAVASPNGTLTADKLVEDSANTVHRVSIQPLSTVIGGTYILSVYAKKAERDWLILRDVSRGLSAWVNLSTGVAGTVQAGLSLSISDMGNGWYRCTLRRTAEDNSVLWGIHSATANGVITYQGDGTSGIYIWGADLRQANTGVNLPPYQRVGASTDYDTAGFPQREYFDGVDDAITTAAGGGGTTAFFFCASINVAAVGVVQTLISDTGTNTGYRVRINAINQLELSAGNGSAYTTATTTGTVSAGRTYVVTCWHDGANLNAQIDNGTVAQQAFATATAGTAAITVGKDNGAASGYFKGSIYAAIYVKDDVQTAAQISSTKKYCAKKGNLTL